MPTTEQRVPRSHEVIERDLAAELAPDIDDVENGLAPEDATGHRSPSQLVPRDPLAAGALEGSITETWSRGIGSSHGRGMPYSAAAVV